MASPNLINSKNGDIQINGGQFVNADNIAYNTSTSNQYISVSAMDILNRHIAPGAFLNSKERFDPPRCDLGTRLAIIDRIMDWITDPNGRSSILWLHGPAGAGKSALGQTIAERCKELGILAAVFFFSRNAVSAERSDGNRLIASLVHQLIDSFPKLRRYIKKRIGTNNRIFDLGLQAQAESLLVYPLNKMSKSFRFLLSRLSTIFYSPYPRLFVVDGLDECQDIHMQLEILEVLARAAKDLNLPFRILVASRPESHIGNFFDHNPAIRHIAVRQLDLAHDRSSGNDIRIYLSRRFKEIVDKHPLREYIPSKWPAPEAIETIASHSSGQFIYATTVVKYIQSPKHQPVDRLDVILGMLEVPRNDKPYAALDSLYTLILSSVADPRVMQIFSVLAITRTSDDTFGILNTPAMIDKLLLYQPGDTQLILSDFLSIVSFDTKDAPIKHYHASLNDFLLDSSRSGILSVDIQKAHEALARGYVNFMSIQSKYKPRYENHHFKSYFVAFVQNYGRLTSGSICNELVVALKNIDFCRIFNKLAFNNNAEHYWLWESGIMEQLFRQLTRSETATNSRILDAQMDTFLQATRRQKLWKPLFELLAKPYFQKSMFCIINGCDCTKDENLKACQVISPLATRLSYYVFYSHISCIGVHSMPGLDAMWDAAGFQLKNEAIHNHLSLAYMCGRILDLGINSNATNKSIDQRGLPTSTAYTAWAFEAHLHHVIFILPISSYSIRLQEYLKKFKSEMDFWSQPDSPLRRFLPQFQELQIQIKVYQQRTSHPRERYLNRSRGR